MAEEYSKPEAMQQSFFDALKTGGTPMPLITWMASQRILSLEALPRYALDKREVWGSGTCTRSLQHNDLRTKPDVGLCDKIQRGDSVVA